MALALGVFTGCEREPVARAASEAGVRDGQVAPLSPPSLTVTSREDARGVPTIAWAQPGTSMARARAASAEEAAWDFLRRHAPAYGLSAQDLGTVYIHHVHDTGRGGIIVRFRQRVAGLEVMRNELKVLMTRERALVGITGNLRGGVARGRAALGADFTLPAAEAVSKALADIHGQSLASTVGQVGHTLAGQPLFDLEQGDSKGPPAVALLTPARVQSVLFPEGNDLHPAYVMDVLSRHRADLLPRGQVYVVDAKEGRILHREDRVSHDVYMYRVWADDDGVPLDGPQRDFSPHPTGDPDEEEPGFIAPISVSKEGLRHRDSGELDPWLPSGATSTFGNNVRAYADHVDPDGLDEGDPRPSVTPGTRRFDDVYDTQRAPYPGDTQAHAAAVQLFYTTNWLHDDFYVSGFTEKAGNAQHDNYGRTDGRLAGDPLLAEVQNQASDPRARNNAFAYVPRDGQSPRLEFFLWETREERALGVVDGPRYTTTGKAAFGAQDFDVSGRLVQGEDAEPPLADGCQPLVNADLEDAIVLLQRGNCNYDLKALHAQQAGAAGLIVVNHLPGAPAPDMFAGVPPMNPSIGALSITHEEGLALAELLAQGPRTAQMARATRPSRDGALDNTVVAHEWGHVLFHRLATCTTSQCDALSEGWSDFIALHLMVRPGEDGTGAYAVGGHASQRLSQSAYYGIRRVPYSRTRAKNGLRLGHISDNATLPTEGVRANGLPNSQMHNAGEVWASMLFEAYLALLDQTKGPTPRIPSFAEARRRMADYVVQGMQAAPVDATFTEQRDALLMAVLADSEEDLRLVAEAFASRGAGTCAVAPPRHSTSFTEVVEGNFLQPDLRVEHVELVEGPRSCDGRDGVFDAEESGLLRVTLKNHGPVAASDTTVRVASEGEVLVFPRGDRYPVDTIGPFSDAVVVSIPVELTGAPPRGSRAAYSVTLDSPSSCQPSVTRHQSVQLNYDLVPSSTDRVEGHRTVWSAVVEEGGPSRAWRIIDSPRAPGERVWFAEDGFDFADTTLVTPELEVPAGERFTFAFEHRHSLASFDNPHTGEHQYWSGGVIEYSLDEGVWQSANERFALQDQGPLDPDTGNPLGGRMAYVARNRNWPDTQTVTLNFGVLSTQRMTRVKVRFRLGSPEALFDYGWEIDNITVQGTLSPPFEQLGDDTGTCRPRALAKAPPSALAETTVELDGALSTDPNGDPLTYVWAQRKGTTATLTDATLAKARFTAPTVVEEEVLTFELTASDGELSHSAEVDILVRPKPVDPDAGTPDAGTPDAGTPDAGPPPDAGEDPDAGTFEPPQRPGMHSCASTGGGAPLGLLGALVLLAARRRRGG